MAEAPGAFVDAFRSLYDTLMTLRPSPVVALNRSIAVAQRDGPERGLEAINAIEDRNRLSAYPFYHAALGELESRRGKYHLARVHFAAALSFARNSLERRFLEERVDACEDGTAHTSPLGAGENLEPPMAERIS
jgi:predicted RNA polymerase sigma factor